MNSKPFVPLVLVSAVLALTMLIAPTAVAGDSVQVVKIHADWCGTCVRLNPTWEALEERHGDDVEFVVFDVTTDETKAASLVNAKGRGLEGLLETYGGRTGTIAIVGPSGGEPVAVLKGETNVEAYEVPIAKARES